MSNESKFKIGEIVVINSGGPRMTVFDVTENNGMQLASVMWWNGDKVERMQLNVACVTPVAAKEIN